MNREELQKVHDALSLLNSMVNCGDQHSPTSVNMTQAAFAILRKPLPPAEGAVSFDNIYELLGQGISRIMRGESSLGSLADEVEAFINSEVQKRSLQSQPTAEGAEEFLRQNHISGADFVYTTGFKNMVALVEQFATLHAQRIADKMVGEKCKKCKYRGLPDSIQEALNSGDGVYRP